MNLTSISLPETPSLSFIPQHSERAFLLPGTGTAFPELFPLSRIFHHNQPQWGAPPSLSQVLLLHKMVTNNYRCLGNIWHGLLSFPSRDPALKTWASGNAITLSQGISISGDNWDGFLLSLVCCCCPSFKPFTYKPSFVPWGQGLGWALVSFVICFILVSPKAGPIEGIFLPVTLGYSEQHELVFVVWWLSCSYKYKLHYI